MKGPAVSTLIGLVAAYIAVFVSFTDGVEVQFCQGPS